jgi:protein ImuA
MSPSPARTEILTALRAEVRGIENARAVSGAPVLPFGIEAIDGRLSGGGLAAGALHEIAPGGAGLGDARLGDEAAATLFLAGIAARAACGTVLWALARRDLFAPGLMLAGLPPERLLQAECGRDEEVLAVMEEGLRHGGLAAVVGETGRAAMAATRRLQLAAEEGGTMALMLRRWRRSGEDPLGLPSAAATRWRIACLPSADLPAPGVGRPRWRLILARQRGGEPNEWIVEGNDESGRLALPAELRHRFDWTGAERAAA